MPAAALANVTVKQVMTHNPVYIAPAASIRELAELLDSNEISGVPVVDVQERVIGVVSKTDLLHQWVRGGDRSRSGGGGGGGVGSFVELLEDGLGEGLEISDENTVEEFMSVDPVTARTDEPITAVAQRMVRERVHRVIVVDQDNRLRGIVTTLDILKRIAG
jgi:CBS domain-containing protein